MSNSPFFIRNLKMLQCSYDNSLVAFKAASATSEIIDKSIQSIFKDLMKGIFARSKNIKDFEKLVVTLSVFRIIQWEVSVRFVTIFRYAYTELS